mgnify:FL=1
MGFETFENPFPFPQVTVIIGKNDTCKTALLKMIYSVGKTTELYTKQTMHNSAASFKNIISKKLSDVYAPKRNGLGDIVRKNGTPKKLFVEAEFDGKVSDVSFSFGMDTRTAITDVNIVNGESGKNSNYIFVPAKEVITAFNAIKAIARQFFFPGYDDTTLDLIDLLDIPVVQGEAGIEFQDILKKMSEMFSGELKQVENTERFVFKKGNTEFALPLTAEGVKHIGILSTLIQNRQLNGDSVLILDEPEDNLHPGAIRSLVKIISALGKRGVQVFVTTHSYFVLKQLHIEARSNEMDVMCCSLKRKGSGAVDAFFSNLKEGLPENSIIDESMVMYDEDINLDLRVVVVR